VMDRRVDQPASRPDVGGGNVGGRFLFYIIILQNKRQFIPRDFFGCLDGNVRRLALGLLELVGEGELGGLLLQLGKLVLVLADLLQGRLDELALHVGHGDGQLVDLEVAEDDLALQEEHLALEAVPLVEVLLADLLQVVHGGGVKVGLGAAPLGDHPEPLLGLPLLLLLQLLGGLLPEQGPQLLLPLGGHESLLLGHGGDGFLLLLTIMRTSFVGRTRGTHYSQK